MIVLDLVDYGRWGDPLIERVVDAPETLIDGFLAAFRDWKPVAHLGEAWYVYGWSASCPFGPAEAHLMTIKLLSVHR